MRKLDPWYSEIDAYDSWYVLAEDIAPEHQQLIEDIFQEGWPELHTWLNLSLPASHYHVYCGFCQGRPRKVLVLRVRVESRESFNQVWGDHILAKA